MTSARSVPEEALAVLGYSPKWLEYGLLSLDLLALQHQSFLAGEDHNTEHYRYAAFLQLLGGGPLSDSRVEQYLELASIDPDEAMARSALYSLLFEPELSEAQFERVARHPWFGPDAKPVRRQRLLRALRREGLNPTLLVRCLAEPDKAVHEALLALPLPRSAVETLAQAGASRRVRNLAEAMLRSRKFREST